MVHRDQLVAYLNAYLKIDEFDDYGPQGLQVQGGESVNSVVTAVSASLQLFNEAAGMGADLVIVHHGLLWDRESRVIRGHLQKRLNALLANDITLLAYHLPLDKHPEVGNNAQAARLLGLSEVQPFGAVGIQGVVQDLSLDSVLKRVKTLFGPAPLVFPYGPSTIRNVGLCSGAGHREIILAVDGELDLFITGEVSESTMHLAKEGGIHCIAAGHYATERLGIRALGEHIAGRFDVKTKFLDIPNPV